jgi:4-aminobutyrate aminotransferase-like enzyme
MVFVDPLFQAVVAKVCKARGIPVVYDEIFVGLYRLGVQSTRELVCAVDFGRVLALVPTRHHYLVFFFEPPICLYVSQKISPHI